MVVFGAQQGDLDPLATVKSLTLLRYRLNKLLFFLHPNVLTSDHHLNCFFFFFFLFCSLLRNPVTNKKHYRLYVINKIPQIRVLDFQKVKLKV